MKQIILITSICLFLFQLSDAQVVINEVCSRNGDLVADEDKDYPDWIELYNTGNTAVNLSGYGLGDDYNNIAAWKFPNVAILAHDFLTIFSSGKNRKEIINHWETIVKAELVWRYLVPLSTPPANWRDLGFDDSGWLQGNGGFGYGDGDDATILAPNTVSVLTRKTFNIVDTSLIGALTFTIDYDDAFVIYLNGVEMVRSNIGVEGVPPNYDQLA